MVDKVTWWTSMSMNPARNTLKIERRVKITFDDLKARLERMIGKKITASRMLNTMIDVYQSVMVDDDGKTLRFMIGYREMNRDMMEYRVGMFRVSEYNNQELVASMLAPAEIVIPDQDIRVLFTYPLSNIVEVHETKPGGFSRSDLLTIIGKTYQRLYDEERDATTKVEPSPCDGNREITNGTHGVWGHEMENLWIETLEYDKKSRVLHLGIGS